MTKVNLFTSMDPRIFLRQSPANKGDWQDAHFEINSEKSDCDWCVIYESVEKPITIQCPQANTILITGEPPDIKTYKTKYLKQFATIITCHKNIKHPNLILSQQSLPWMLSIYHHKSKTIPNNYNSFKKNKIINKPKLMSIISSNKTQTRGQQQRLKFVKAVKQHFGNQIDVFGAGINPIPDKWEGIAPYKYHIAIENSVIDNYWTEKLADPFLAKTYPIYHGCTNIFDYFPTKSLSPINILEIDKSIKSIEDILKKDLCQKNKNKLGIKQAKQMILDKYNIFPMIYEIIQKKIVESRVNTITIKPENDFLTKNKIKRIFKI